MIMINMFAVPRERSGVFLRLTHAVSRYEPKCIFCLLAAFAVAVFAAPQAQAQSAGAYAAWQNSAGVVLRSLAGPVPKWNVTVGMGLEAQPRYEGSNQNQIYPAPNIDIRYRDLAFASLGEGIGVNLLRGKLYRAGIALGFDPGREHNYATRLAGTGNIDPSPTIRAFGQVALLPFILTLDINQDMIGSQGLQAEFGTYMPVYGSKKLVVFVGPSLTVANRQYMQSYFGITSPHAIPHSEFPTYSAHGGLKSAHFGLVAIYHLNEHWFFDGDLGGERLLGSADNSPIVQDRYQWVASLGFGYTF